MLFALAGEEVLATKNFKGYGEGNTFKHDVFRNCLQCETHDNCRHSAEIPIYSYRKKIVYHYTMCEDANESTQIKTTWQTHNSSLSSHPRGFQKNFCFN